MFKSNDLLALGFGAVAIASLLALPLLSPVPASASHGYLPEEIENQGQAIELLPDDWYGDSGLPGSFPKEDPVSLQDATPEMYS